MRQIIRVLVVALVLALLALASAQMDKWMAHPDFSRGVDAYDNDEYEEAFKYFSNELASYPDNGYAQLYLGSIYFESDMTGEAISCLTKAKAAIPANDKEYRSAAIGVLGKAYLAAGDSLQAIQCYNEALKLAPDNARIIKARAEYYSDREEYSLAEADLQKFGRLLPGDPYAWFARGIIALAKDELYF